MSKIATLLRESGSARFLIPVGIMLVIFGTLMFYINAQNQDYVKATATVTRAVLAEEAYTDADGNRVEATYDVDITYIADGGMYAQTLTGMSECKAGDKLTIYYDPSDPSRITQTKSLIIPLIMIVGGAAALVGGIGSGKNALKRYKKMKEQEKGWTENGK